MNNAPERDDDYLWDRSGPVDADVAELERRLAPQAWKPRHRVIARPRRTAPHARRRRPWRFVVASAAAAAMLALGLQAWVAYRLHWPTAQPWRITATEGPVTMAGVTASAAGALAPGVLLETGDGATARLQVARIGEMILGEGSRFELVETGDGRHRARLQRGSLWARIWAPPGAFGVSTPAGEVFDLGCEFLLQAEQDGSGALTVRSGWVQVDNLRREVLVLAVVEEMRYEEIASTLAIPVGTVMSRLSRAREKLRAAFADGPGTPSSLKIVK